MVAHLPSSEMQQKRLSVLVVGGVQLGVQPAFSSQTTGISAVTGVRIPYVMPLIFLDIFVFSPGWPAGLLPTSCLCVAGCHRHHGKIMRLKSACVSNHPICLALTGNQRHAARGPGGLVWRRGLIVEG